MLEELALDYPLPQLILEYRSLSKLKSTYTDTLPQQVNPKTGRIHTSYQQAVATTGRLSSINPNLQNIPIRTAEGRRIRRSLYRAKRLSPVGSGLFSNEAPHHGALFWKIKNYLPPSPLAKIFIKPPRRKCLIHPLNKSPRNNVVVPKRLTLD